MNNILIINGIYDIICGISILFFNNIFSKLHTSLFKEDISDINKRFLAYWILTYGFIRLYVGFFNNYELLIIGSITYILEALFLEYELLNNNMDVIKTHIVSLFSILLAIIIWI
jgi:hypothetical protein